jgi:hypothetical protein
LSFALAETVANAVLYEGYVLYPYRASSAKNRVRFQFGVVAPRAYVEAGGSDPWEMQTECLVEPGASPLLDIKVRFLQLQARAVEAAAGDGSGGFQAVEFLDLEGERLTAWDEGVERQLEISGIAVRDLVGGERQIPLTAPAGWETEELRTAAGHLRGRLVRERWAIAAVVRLAAEEVDGLLRLRVRIENQTLWPPRFTGSTSPAPSTSLTPLPHQTPLPPPTPPTPPTTAPDRDLALRRSLLGAHTLLAVRDGAFVSLLDPPAAAARAAAGCANVHAWPVLIGREGSRDVMLSSPIILYDYPAVAPESPGDLCDSTEIDEILTLRIMTLTEEEKREARGTDERARQIVARADAMPPEILERLHGAMRALAPAAPPAATAPAAPAEVAASTPPAERTAPSLTAELASWESFLNPPGMLPPEEATLQVGAVALGKGSRVRLRPSRRADSMDLFLAGRTAQVAAVYRDVEDAAYLALTLDDDPAADLHAWIGRYFYFYPDEVEPLAGDGAPASAPAASGEDGAGDRDVVAPHAPQSSQPSPSSPPSQPSQPSPQERRG